MPLLLTNWFLDPIVAFLSSLVLAIDGPVRNLGWSLVILAALIRLAFWGLNVRSFKAMLAMQRLGPKLKRLQQRYKDDPQRLQQETMALYKSEGVNPFAGCLPMLIQLPIIYAVFWVVMGHRSLYDHAGWLWIGSPLAAHWPQIFAPSLARPDVPLLVLYTLSMYFSVRYGSMPATDPQQAQTQKMMAWMMPLIFAFSGFRMEWPSAMVLYWLASNLFQMAQTIYLLRKYHQPLSVLDSEHVITDDLPAPALAAASAHTNGAAASGATTPSKKKKSKNR